MNLFKLAFLHNAYDLKDKCMALIGQNVDTIKTTPAFRDLKNETYGFDAVVEILSYIRVLCAPKSWSKHFFSAVFNFLCSFQTFFSDFTAEINKVENG